MKTITALALVSVSCLIRPALGQDLSSQGWRFRFDIGGTIPENPTLSDIGGPITSGGKMELSAGMAFDLAAGYRITPWFTLEGELGFTYNNIDAVGNWSYPNSSLSQMLMMLNAEFSFPIGRFRPFAGIGAGGVYSTVSFGNYYYYYYSDSDGWGDDFVPAAQAFAGLRFEIDQNWSIGVAYHFIATPSQEWNVNWWNNADFEFGVDRICIHSICISVTGSF